MFVGFDAQHQVRAMSSDSDRATVWARTPGLSWTKTGEVPLTEVALFRRT